MTTESDPSTQTPPAPRRLDVRRAGIWLAGAWLIPTATHLLGVDWLLPPLILLLTAGLLRSGRTLLDRLVLGTALLLGATAAAGLLFTAWPFGLAPVPVAGTALTVLGAISLATRRAPRLPRPTPGDGATVLVALGAVGYIGLPYLRADATDRLALLLGAEDSARHLDMFETLRRIGGYAFWKTPAEVPDLFSQLRFYPTGWHLNSALLDGFVRSSTGPAGADSTIVHYLGFTLATYFLFALVVLWAARRLAGPLLTFWRAVPLLGFLGLQLIYGELPALTAFGFVSEIFGLIALVVLITLVARPLERAREQMVLIGTLVAMIGFGYELLLPPAGLAALVWLVTHRRQVARHWRFALGTALVAGPLAVVTVTMGTLYGGHATLIRSPGGLSQVNRSLLLALAAVVLAALVAPGGRRLRAWRSYAFTVAATLALPVAIEVYLNLTDTVAVYYREKAWHAVLVVLLIGSGALVRLAPAPRRHERPWSRRTVRGALTPVLLAGAMAAFAGVVVNPPAYGPIGGDALSRAWHAGRAVRDNQEVARNLVEMDRRFPQRGNTVTMVLADTDYASYRYTLYLSTMQRTAGLTQVVMYHSAGFTLVPEYLGPAMMRAVGPMRVIIIGSRGEAVVEGLRARFPDLDLDVQRL